MERPRAVDRRADGRCSLRAAARLRGVDSASTEADHELLVLENRSPPQGYTAPANAGIRAARGRYIVVLNDDVELLEGWWPP